MKVISNTAMYSILGLIGVMMLSSCESNPITLALHDPIQPAANESVTFNLERVTSGTINSAQLLEQVTIINSAGTATTTNAEVQLQSWTAPGGNLSHTKAGGYPSNAVITYQWVVRTPGRNGSEDTKRFRVTFSTRPYPVANQPAPVYIQGDRNDVFDVVFIPDTDISNLNTFRNHCRLMIRESFFDEPTTRIWRRQFNFYINPNTGHATDYDRRATDGNHQVPSNNAQLSFAEGRCLMHQTDLRDYASGGLFSTEMQNRGTVLHESGHALFDLADEYINGSHWQETDFPNNWNSQAGANAAADDYGSCKSLADVFNIQSGWWRLCTATCQMTATGLTHTTYDCPCKDRIVHMVFKTAAN